MSAKSKIGWYAHITFADGSCYDMVNFVQNTQNKHPWLAYEYKGCHVFCEVVSSILIGFFFFGLGQNGGNSSASTEELP